MTQAQERSVSARTEASIPHEASLAKGYMNQGKPLALYLWFIYAFVALWPLRFYVTELSFISLGQLAVIIPAFLCLLYENAFSSYGTKDDLLVLLWVFFIAANSFIQGILQHDAALQLIQLRSLGTSLLIILPYFVSRSIRLGRYKGTFIHCLLVGMAILVLYKTYWFLGQYLTSGNAMRAGRATVAQRYPVVINFVFLAALLFEAKAKWRRGLAFCVASLSLLLMVVSLTRGAYLAIVIDYIILVCVRPKKIIGFTVLLIVLLSGMSVQYREEMAPLWRAVKSRVEFTVETAKNPAIDESAYDRIAMWKTILDTNLASPLAFLFGSGELGIGQLGKTAKGFRGDFVVGSAHSQYFDALTRRGVVGLALFLIVLYRMVRVAWRLRHDGQYGWFYTALAVGFIAVVAYDLFEESFRFMTFGLFFYAMYGMLVSEGQSLKGKDVPDRLC